ncbi:hypothetical protein DNTS_029327 [Danionella cerebrum]|uniref:Uncharacterized protein n=1 Tax=Danionella cerebrum TaxID=2873325 RepID=A0A553NN72_9TELE|nr:hypothetical protein DNTS_029327 [Danionella translucida]
MLIKTNKAEEVDDGDNKADQGSTLTGGVLPVYVVVFLVVGGLVFLLNPLICFLLAKRRRGRSLKEDTRSISQETKSEEQRSTSSTSSRYASRELINTLAQRTLLIDSSSEPDSSIYESYGRQQESHYYYPTDAYTPALYTHPEGPEDHDGRHGMSPHAHEYEDVRAWGLYEEFKGPPLLPPAYYESTAYGKLDADMTSGVYDSMVYRRRRDSELPFELRGELV